MPLGSFSCANGAQISTEPASKTSNAADKTPQTIYKYKFENPRFYTSVIEVDLALDASGELRFKRGESDDIIEREIKVLPATLNHIGALVDRVGFLTSNEEYQNKKDFSHLGWMTITVRQSDRERTVRFNYTTNPQVNEIGEIFRGIATQQIDLFDLDLALRHQPLDTPRVLEAIENDLRLDRVAEPEQLMATLRDLANDDTLPLIARNHATRLVTAIQKGKFKTPLKSGR